MKKLLFSTVLYNTPIKDIKNLMDSIESLILAFKEKKINIKVTKLLIRDNSKNPTYSKDDLNLGKYAFKVDLIRSHRNLGYGLGHNHNLLEQNSNKDIWFTAINPDVYFQGKKLVSFFEFVTSSNLVSCAAPLIYLPNGNIQYSAKKNPTMLSLLISRFSFFQKLPILKKYLIQNQNRYLNYEKEFIKSTFLSGCFLTFPSETYKKIKGFSENYFLHFEDADIVRRSSFEGKTMHCPLGQITHIRGRGSHKSLFQQYHLIISYMRYSMIWGFRLF